MDNNIKHNNNFLLIILCGIISFAGGLLGAYVIGQTVTTQSVVKNITRSELVENSISASVDNVYNSVVVVLSYKNGALSSTGTGFVYKVSNGKTFIMTNNHVIDSADKVEVEFNNSEEKITATIVGSDTYADVAVLTIEGVDVDSVEIGSSSDLKLGDTVFTVGSPMGIEYKGTVTKGILSGKDRFVSVSLSNSNVNDYYMKVLQLDAAVNPGNSGGPLCDVSGNVVGIISLKIVEDSVEGMGFAIPIEDALEIAAVLEKDGKIERPYIGISMVDVTNASYYTKEYSLTIPDDVKEGVVILSVEKNTPAENAGLLKGDIITKLGEQEITNLAEFRYYLYKYNVGSTVSITFLRDGIEKTTNITLGKKQ